MNKKDMEERAEEEVEEKLGHKDWQFIREPKFTELVNEFENFFQQKNLRDLEIEVLLMIVSDRHLMKKQVIKQEKMVNYGTAGQLINQAKKMFGRG